MNIKKYYWLVVMACMPIYTAYCQTDQKQIQRIDSLFDLWNTSGHPGGAIMVIKDNKIICSKAYGLANIELDISNSPHILFNIGSISKQFTAIGIAILEAQKKLSFDDDIRKHLPELPDFGETITIQHLLNHTSGLRDMHGLLGLAGWRRNDLETNEDVYRVIKNQKTLNFKPGEEFLYCNTGYVLLAKVIEHIDKLPFHDWMKKHVFDPLRMKNTYVESGSHRVAPNKAISYDSKQGFKRVMPYWGYTGAGNMYSTIGDLALWVTGFGTSPKKNILPFQKLLTVTPLNNGVITGYAFGVRVGKHLGKKVIQHGGAVGGFRSIVRIYPEEQLTIIMLSNFSGSNILSKSNKIAKMILGGNDVQQKKKIPKQQPGTHVSLSKTRLMKFSGFYWNPTEKYGRKIYLKNDTLRYWRANGDENLLVPINNNTFQMLNIGVKVLVRFEGSMDNSKMIVLLPNESPVIFKLRKYSLRQRAYKFSNYVGDYYSSELKTTYSISFKESGIFCEHIRHGKIKLKQLYKDIFRGTWPVGILEVIRDNKGNIEGLKISNGRTRDVWFKKQ
ncbi:hypothetical protein BKI52_08595 [marine bacterium AO1-C]|nr:hypothetical protein BKI52_08595 [marine bacterium AO1-C]